MSELGQFLETVYSPGNRFQTVQAVISNWQKSSLEDRADGGTRKPIGLRKTRILPIKTEETDLSVSISLPSGFRIERISGANDASVDTLLIANENQWWRRDQSGDVQTDRTNQRKDRSAWVPGLTSIERHFMLASLREYFVALGLEQTGKLEHVGRECIRIRAVPRPDGSLWPHWLPSGANEYEFFGDIERGTLLYIAGIYQGEVLAIHNVKQVTYDKPLDDQLFIYEPAQHQELRKAAPIAEHLTLESVVSRVGFKIFLPSWLPGATDAGFEVIYHASRHRSPRQSVTIMYRSGYSLWIDESDLPDPDLDTLEFETFDRAGKKISISDPGEGLKVLSMQQEGTNLAFYSSLERNELIEVAISLNHVPKK